MGRSVLGCRADMSDTNCKVCSDAVTASAAGVKRLGLSLRRGTLQVFI